jgi:sterol 3beta-glucosyltransferase
MKIAFVAAGSRGDVQPMANLAGGFQAAGYDVRFCAAPSMLPIAESASLEFAALLGTDPKKVNADDHSKAKTSAISRIGTVLRRRRHIPDSRELSRLVEVCSGCDAVVFNHISTICLHIAEYLHIPCAGAFLVLALPSRSYIYPCSLPPIPLGTYNQFSHFMFERLYHSMAKEWIADFRAKLGLTPLHRSFISEIRRRQIPIAVGVSPSLFPTPSEWPSEWRITGYWNTRTGSLLPLNVRTFLEKTRGRVIAVTFGGAVDPNAGRAIWMINESLNQNNMYAVYVSGWNKEVNTEGMPRILQAKYLDYRELFRAVTGIVFSGSSSIAADILNAKKPSLPIPFTGEQMCNARRLAKCNASVEPIRRSEMTADRVASGLLQMEAVGSSTHFASLCRQIESEDGVRTAFEFLQPYLLGYKK